MRLWAAAPDNIGCTGSSTTGALSAAARTMNPDQSDHKRDEDLTRSPSSVRSTIIRKMR